MGRSISLLKVHGSMNDIFIIEEPPEALFPVADISPFVQLLCDRSGPFGGDGVYFLDAQAKPVTARFFNPDGSPAKFCGNGMRAVGRLLLERSGEEEVTVWSDGVDFKVRRAAPTAEGVIQTVVDLPPVDFDPQVPIVAGGGTHVDEVMPALHPAQRYTALAVPNSHLVSMVSSYDRAELVEAGERLAATPEVFPIGANISHVIPLAHSEVFIHTYERGAGLTMSCGSGVAAARAVCSKLGIFDPGERVVMRNPGGVSRAWLRSVNGQWLPSLEGNATFVYRTAIDASVLLEKASVPIDLDADREEIAAFGALDDANMKTLRAAGVQV